MDEFSLFLDPEGVLHFVVDDPARPLEVMQCGNAAPINFLATQEPPEFPLPLSKVCQGCAEQFGFGAKTWPEHYAKIA